MPLAAFKEICVKTGCKNPVSEHHHVVYDSNDVDRQVYDDKTGQFTTHPGRHYYCRRNVKKGNTVEDHRAEIVPICREHHESVTRYNERMWMIFNKYEPLSCHQRRYLFELWVMDKFPPGIFPLDEHGNQEKQ